MKRTHQNEQAGMVAIIVTMIMIFVITLIVIGFSQVTRRNQREALDSQLASQAYYAAETGVNDVIKYAKNPTNLASMATNTGCNDGAVTPRAIKSDNSVATTCIMVDPNPTSLLAGTINPSADSVEWHVKNASSNPFSSLSFTWSPDPDAQGTGSCKTAANSYVTPAVWNGNTIRSCKFALLRVDLVPAGTPLDAVSLTAANKTLFLKPSITTTTPTLGAPAAYQAGCSPSGGVCTVRVNVSASEYYMRVTSQYVAATSLVVKGYEGVTNTPAKFVDGQIVVDSTGRAQDQVKRIQVRVPFNKSSDLPVFGLQSATTICKNLLINPAIPKYDRGACTSIW